jgi:hypothetical protein
MSIIFKSFLGTLAAVSMLACTAGATLYLCRCMDYAIHDAVAHHFAEMHESAMYHFGMEALGGAPVGCAEFDEMHQPCEGAPIDSKIVAALIDELGEAGPEEREAWTNLLRHPGSHEAYRSLFAHYRGRAPQNFQGMSPPVQAASAVERPALAPSGPCPGAEFPECGNSSAMIKSALEALQAAEQLLLEKAMSEDLSKLRQLREELIEQQQSRLRDQPADSGNSSTEAHE